MAGAFNAAGLALANTQGQFLLTDADDSSHEYAMIDDPNAQLMREIQAASSVETIDPATIYQTTNLDEDLEATQTEDHHEYEQSYAGSPEPVDLHHVNARLLHDQGDDQDDEMEDEMRDTHEDGCNGAAGARTPLEETTPQESSGSHSGPDSRVQKTSEVETPSPRDNTPSIKGPPKQLEKAPTLTSLLTDHVEQAVSSIAKLGEEDKEHKADYALHKKAHGLIPHSIPAHRYWIAVLMHDVSPKATLQEHHFLWLRGNRVRTISP